MNHCLTEINLQNRTAICSVCGPTQFRDKGKGKGRVCIAKLRERAKKYARSEKGKLAVRVGQRRFYERNGSPKAPWRKFVKPVCERCGIKPVDIVLMDGHHKDRNRHNNDESNIESVCAFCHRLIHRGLEHLIQPFGGAGLPVSSHITPVKPSGDILTLLNDIERLEGEKKALEEKVQKVARLTDSEKLILFIRKYDQLKAQYDEIKFRMDGLEH